MRLAWHAAALVAAAAPFAGGAPTAAGAARDGTPAGDSAAGHQGPHHPAAPAPTARAAPALPVVGSLAASAAPSGTDESLGSKLFSVDQAAPSTLAFMIMAVLASNGVNAETILPLISVMYWSGAFAGGGGAAMMSRAHASLLSTDPQCSGGRCTYS